jgi:hypothetical protein
VRGAPSPTPVASTVATLTYCLRGNAPEFYAACPGSAGKHWFLFVLLRKGKCCPIFRGAFSQEWLRAIARSPYRMRGNAAQFFARLLGSASRPQHFTPLRRGKYCLFFWRSRGCYWRRHAGRTHNRVYVCMRVYLRGCCEHMAACAAARGGRSPPVAMNTCRPGVRGPGGATGRFVCGGRPRGYRLPTPQGT